MFCGLLEHFVLTVGVLADSGKKSLILQSTVTILGQFPLVMPWMLSQSEWRLPQREVNLCFVA